jgi:hypothetical protein
MKYCPNCGASLEAGKSHCVRCGAALPSSPAAPTAAAPRSNRGLYIAIACVAVLCVLTAGLWMLWPHLHPAPVSGSTPASVTITPASTPGSDKSMVLKTETWWHGYLYVLNYQGSDNLEGETMEVWGYLDSDREGRTYFEVYDRKEITEETNVVVSFYTELYPDHLVPIIGEKDAWVLDQYLIQQDGNSLRVFLSDNCLELTFPYKSASESFDVDILLFPD